MAEDHLHGHVWFAEGVLNTHPHTHYTHIYVYTCTVKLDKVDIKEL
jgi:hypothetical protein